MPHLLVSPGFMKHRAAELEELSQRSTIGPLSISVLPPAPMDPAFFDGIDAVFVSLDLASGGTGIRQLMEMFREAPSIRWLHLGWVGTDSPMVQALMAKGVVIS